MKLLGRCLPVFAIAVAFGQAATAEDIAGAIKACRAEPDDSRRLACYDRAAGRAQPAVAAVPPASTATAPAAATTAVPAEARAATAADRFGRERALENAEADRKEEEARSLGALEATVSGIAIRADGLMTITLDNGQVWRQNSPDAKFRLKNSDPVLIQPASMNSYILSGPSKRSTRVTRVK